MKLNLKKICSTWWCCRDVVAVLFLHFATTTTASTFVMHILWLMVHFFTLLLLYSISFYEKTRLKMTLLLRNQFNYEIHLELQLIMVLLFTRVNGELKKISF